MQTNKQLYSNNKEKSNIISKYLLIFVIVTFVQIGLLFLTAIIPGDTINSNLKESADFLTDKELFFNIQNDNIASRVDRYADSILLGIIYGYDHEHPLTSIMSSSYYHTDTANENYNLKDAVYNNLAPNYDYSRYWHGSSAYVKPLLIFFNLREIYLINAVILIILLIAMMISIVKYISKGAAVCFFISAMAVSIWYVPFSLEYTWNFFIMMISSLIIMSGYRKTNSHNKLMPVFFVTGSMTAYFDFLTTETLTLLIPLTLLVVMEYDAGKLDNIKSGLRTCISAAILWGIGYISCWLAKWTLASIVLKENAFASAFSNATIRMYGEADNLSKLSQIFGAIIRNLSCILPFNHIAENGYVFCIIFYIVLLMIYYLVRNDNGSCILPRLLILPAIVPYIRYIVMSNHSYIHYFFTFRAQMATIFCIALIFYYGVDRKLLQKEWKKIYKKKQS